MNYELRDELCEMSCVNDEVGVEVEEEATEEEGRRQRVQNQNKNPTQ